MHQHHSLTIADDKWWRHQLGHMTRVCFALNKLIFGDISENEYDVMALYINFQLSVTSATLETERWSVLHIISWLSSLIFYTYNSSNATECHFGSKRMLGALLQTPQSILTVSSLHRASQSNPTKHHIVVKEILQERAINCLKNVRIWSFSGPYFPEFGLNADQKKLRIRTLFTQCKLPEGLKDLTRLTKK